MSQKPKEFPDRFKVTEISLKNLNEFPAFMNYEVIARIVLAKW